MVHQRASSPLMPSKGLAQFGGVMVGKVSIVKYILLIIYSIVSAK